MSSSRQSNQQQHQYHQNQEHKEQNQHQQQQQQQQHKSNKLKSLSATVSLAFLLVGFSFVVYLRSFVALHASILAAPMSTLPPETIPWRFVAMMNPQLRTIENVSVSPIPQDHHGLVTRDEDGDDRSGHGGQQDGNLTRNSSQFGHGSAKNSRNSSSVPVDLEEDDAAGAADGLDLQQLLNIVAGSKRRQWLKQHWAEVRILQSDETSELFLRRVNSFLRKECPLRFFMTWISSVESYGERELHCLESVFKHHPLACVVIVSRSMDSPRGSRLLQPLLDHGYRVMAAAPDLPFLFRNTPAQPWLKNLKKGRIDPGEISFNQNLSNILRLLLLYKFGGVYLDTDVLLLRNFTNLSNSIGAQTEDHHTGNWLRINNAVLVFDRNHPLLNDFIREFALTFNGSKWGHNGPYLATRVLARQMKSRGKPNCNVLRTSAFYPVTWSHMPRLFLSPKDDKERLWQETKIDHLLQNSYSIHLWNKETRDLKVEPGSLIDRLFSSQCVLCGLEEEDDDDSTEVGVA